MVRIKRFTHIFCSLLLIFISGSAQRANRNISITIKLEKPSDTFTVKIAPLKYNKDFAFSFTLDDGLTSDYLVAFPYFSGGTVSGKYIDQWGYDQGADGKYYPGLFYTDGCGHSIPFKAGIAINAKNINGADTIFHHGFLTWKQLKDLSDAGWDILNHGYSHATGKNVNAKYEIKKNNEAVKKHIGIEMKDFVIPGGHDDYISDTSYTKRAFEAGMETVQCEHFGNYLIKIDSTLNLAHLKLGRKFLHTSRTGFPNFKDLERLSQNKGFWINAFTHGAGNQNIWNISLIFPQFRSFFQNYIYNMGKEEKIICGLRQPGKFMNIYSFLSLLNILYKKEKNGLL